MDQQPDANLDQSRYEFAADFIRRFAPTLPGGTGTVFDIGAGKMPMRPAVEGANLEWVGFDLFPADPAVQRWDLSEPCPVQDRKADLAIMLDVVEHLLNPGLGLRNIADVLKPGGVLLLTTPNPRWSRSRTHHLFYGTAANFTQHDLDVNHHVFTPWPHVLKKMLADVGLAVEEYVTLDGREGWPPKLSPALPLVLLEAAGRKLIERFDRSACGMSFAFVTRLKAG